MKATFSKSRIRTIVEPAKEFSVGQESETKTLALPSIRSVSADNQKAGCFGWLKRLFSKSPPTTTLPLPKIIHRVWVGEKDISKEHLYNILLDAHFNLEHRIVIHTDRIKSIVSILDEMRSSEEQLPQFRKMAKKYASRIEIKTVDELEERLKEKGYSSAAKFMAAAERERYPGSPYCNPAAASDCYRLAALYVDGGIYKDTDVMSQWAFPKSIYPKHGFMMTNNNWNFGNNVLVGQPEAFLIKKCMDEIVSSYDSYENTEELTKNKSAFSARLMRACKDTWGVKRSANEAPNPHSGSPRTKGTVQVTGPALITEVLLPKHIELTEYDEYSIDYARIGGCSMSVSKMRDNKTEKHILAKTKANDILFANYCAGPDAKGLWNNISPIKRRAIESPF